MEIKKTTTHKVTFVVSFYEGKEGGMDSGEFGKPQAELKDAISLLELAKVSQPNREWVIVCEVETKNT